MCLWLLWNSVGKKNTLLRFDLNFPFQNAVLIFLDWLFDGTAQTHLWALKRKKKNVKGAALELPPGLMRPGPCDPVVCKTTSLPALFAVHTCTSLEVYFIDTVCEQFNMYTYSINTHFDMFLNNVTCMLVVLFFLWARKHESKVPTNIITRMGK